MIENPAENQTGAPLSVRDLHPDFLQMEVRGERAWGIAGLPVQLTPLRVHADDPTVGDAPALLRIFADSSVQEYIENSANTGLNELVSMAREIHAEPGYGVRFAVRDASQALLGVVNCLELSEQIVAWNAPLMGRLLAGSEFCAELAYYHAQAGGTGSLLLIRDGERNILAEETRQRWLERLRSPQFDHEFAAYRSVIGTVIAKLETISTGGQAAAGGKAVLCSSFALGYALMVRLLSDILAQRGISGSAMRLLLFSDAHNRASLRMLLPFGGQLEGFCQVPNPDGTPRMRVALAQPLEGIERFLTYYQQQAADS